MNELTAEIHAQIVQLCEEGNDLQEVEAWNEAIAKFEEAFALLPEPKYMWEAATWLLTAIADAAFEAGQYERASDAFRQAMLCPNAVESAFVRLRRGQIFLELGDVKKAEEELAGAYMLAGSSIFEHEDPKYFAHLKRVLRPPASHKW